MPMNDEEVMICRLIFGLVYSDSSLLELLLVEGLNSALKNDLTT